MHSMSRNEQIIEKKNKDIERSMKRFFRSNWVKKLQFNREVK